MAPAVVQIDPVEVWRVYEVNVLGVHLCCRAVIPEMLKHGRGRIAITTSAAAYLPGGDLTAYPPSKARKRSGCPAPRVNPLRS